MKTLTNDYGKGEGTLYEKDILSVGQSNKKKATECRKRVLHIKGLVAPTEKKV